MLTDFQNSFTGRLSGKFVTNSHLNIPPHLTYVATLPCEISMFKNRHVLEVIEANCHVRLSHSKTVLKYLSGKYLLFNSLAKRCPHQPYKNPNIDYTQLL